MPSSRTDQERINFVLNVFMILVYGLAGIALFFWNGLMIPEQNRKILSGVLILYSLFRLYKLLRKNKHTDQ